MSSSAVKTSRGPTQAGSGFVRLVVLLVSSNTRVPQERPCAGWQEKQRELRSRPPPSSGGGPGGPGGFYCSPSQNNAAGAAVGWHCNHKHSGFLPSGSYRRAGQTAAARRGEASRSEDPGTGTRRGSCSPADKRRTRAQVNNAQNVPDTRRIPRRQRRRVCCVTQPRPAQPALMHSCSGWKGNTFYSSEFFPFSTLAKNSKHQRR